MKQYRKPACLALPETPRHNCIWEGRSWGSMGLLCVLHIYSQSGFLECYRILGNNKERMLDTLWNFTDHNSHFTAALWTTAGLQVKVIFFTCRKMSVVISNQFPSGISNR